MHAVETASVSEESSAVEVGVHVEEVCMCMCTWGVCSVLVYV